MPSHLNMPPVSWQGDHGGRPEQRRYAVGLGRPQQRQQEVGS